jgi:hypothetical protein
VPIGKLQGCAERLRIAQPRFARVTERRRMSTAHPEPRSVGWAFASHRNVIYSEAADITMRKGILNSAA